MRRTKLRKASKNNNRKARVKGPRLEVPNTHTNSAQPQIMGMYVALTMGIWEGDVSDEFQGAGNGLWRVQGPGRFRVSP